jgi:hypothetical protein
VLHQNVADVVRQPLLRTLLPCKTDKPAPVFLRDTHRHDGFWLNSVGFHFAGSLAASYTIVSRSIFMRKGAQNPRVSGTPGDMGLKLFTIGNMAQEPPSRKADESSAKVQLQVRVAPKTREQAEEWVRRYATKMNRPDVLRTLLEMGLKAAKKPMRWTCRRKMRQPKLRPSGDG